MAEKKLKTVVTADTSNFNKGMRESKEALKDFQKQGESALSGISSALGDTSGALGTLGRNIKNATTLFTDMASQGGTALTSLERSTIALKGALSGLGITAAITAFRELNAMADMFKQTIEGANLELQAQVYRDTFRMAMEDQLGQGAGWQKTKNGFKQALTEIGTTAGNLVVTTARSAFQSMYSFEGAGAGLQRLANDWQSVFDAASNSIDKASAASQYQGQLNKALDDRMRKAVEWQRLSREIAENERIASDSSLSQAERQAAISEAMRLTTELSRQQESSAREIYKWTSLVDEQASNSKEDTQRTIMAQAEIDRIIGQQETKMKSLVRLQNRINKGSGGGTSGAAKTSIEAYESALEQVVGKAMAAQLESSIMNEMVRNDVDVQRIFNEGYASMIKNVPSLQGQAFSLKAPVTLVPQVDTEATQKAIIELADVLESGVAGMSEALGGLIGDLINGEDAWGNFAQAGISVVADMLATVGKAFIAEGMGVIAAQAALVTGGGAGAVAAGAAMVALAATMKAAMSNAASSWGGGGYSTSVASSAYTSGAAGPSTFGREMNVKVTGTLTANGSKLVAVLNNERNRTDYTT